MSSFLSQLTNIGYVFVAFGVTVVLCIALYFVSGDAWCPDFYSIANCGVCRDNRKPHLASASSSPAGGKESPKSESSQQDPHLSNQGGAKRRSSGGKVMPGNVTQVRGAQFPLPPMPAVYVFYC